MRTRADAAVLEVARSDTEAREAECDRLRMVFDATTRRGDPPEQALPRVIAACDDALAANPDSSQAYAQKAWVYSAAGEYQALAGTDPREVDREGVEMAKEAIRLEAVNKGLDLDPSRGSAWAIRGDAELLAARVAVKQGRSPQTSLQAAERDYQHAHQLLPRDAVVLRGLAEVQWQKAEWELAGGKRPTESVQAGLQAAASAIELRADDAEAYRLRGELEGLGADIWQGIDAQAYVEEIRKEWDGRP